EEPRGDVRHRRERGRGADRTRRVHADERLQVRADGAGQELLGLHDAFQLVGRLAHDDGVDVAVVEARVGERAVHCLAHQARDAEVASARSVLRLPDADHRDRAFHVHLRSLPRTKKRFCCKQWPCAAWAITLPTFGTAWVPARPLSCRKASPSRMSPVIMSGWPQSGPPEGFSTERSPAWTPIASRRINSSAGVALHSSITSASRALASPAMANAFSAASFAPALCERSRAPIVCISVRLATPLIH